MASNNTINGGAYSLKSNVDAVNDYWLVQNGSVYYTMNRNVLMGVTGTPADLTTTQTVQNKTLNNTNAITVKDGSYTLQNSSDTTKQAVFSLASITTATTRTYTLPNYSATFMTLAGTETGTNKTFTSPTINSPTITNASISSDAITGYTTSNAGSIYGMAVTSGTIGSSQIATNGVGGSNLSTTAILLGTATISTDVTTTATSNTQLTGLTTTVTVPAGGRSVKVSVILPNPYPSTTGLAIFVSLWRGTVGSGTAVGGNAQFYYTDAFSRPIFNFGIDTPSAGSVTYNVGWYVSTGTGHTNGGQSKCTLLVELL